jgi:hypothetical protein
VTFVYGSRDQEHNAATVLKELLESTDVEVKATGAAASPRSR